MRSSHSLDRLDTAFDDDRLVADAGLLVPATLAHRRPLIGPLGTFAVRRSPVEPCESADSGRQAGTFGGSGLA